MVQIIKVVAPDATTKTDNVSDLGTIDQESDIADDIAYFQQNGYSIVVDDLGFEENNYLKSIIAAATNGNELSLDQTTGEIAIGALNSKPIIFFTAAGNVVVTTHALDPNEISVGAVNWINTPFGGVPDFKNESFSSPTADISAPDSGPTSVSGFNPFYGTSAASPAAAALAALMLQRDNSLSPEEVRFLLENTAVHIPVGDPSVTGYGLIDADAAVAAACYCRATLILAELGEVPIEDLAIGDAILTMSGATRPIKWIGRRSYGGPFLFGQKHILPICLKAGCLDENMPRRDLWVSPHHAMYLEGVLIEAKDLVNGVSVVQAKQVEKVDYFHIELETHDIVIAEGAFSETFVDDDSRGMFHNAHEYFRLYPEEIAGPARYCAPRLGDGYVIQAIRDRIETRAGLRLTARPRTSELRGYIDMVDPCLIAGWAQSLDHLEAPVCLDILADGRLIGQTLANRYREDLQRARFGSGRHGFEFIPPEAARVVPRSIEVRRSLDGKPLLRASMLISSQSR
jgi:hypothetical protein